TPPTSDCQSGSNNCELVTDRTRLDLTLSENNNYSLTVRPDTCGNAVQGPESIPLSISLTDMNIERCAVQKRFNPNDG
ncbi:hypothetical protein GBAR_LOCUS6320, partial [Geodia barretti]